MRKFILFALILTMGLLSMEQEIKGQTKVFDQTITWTHPPYANGGYGFYWWHRTDGQSIYNYGNMPSDNWVSPTDYYNGNFTMSVEVISQPTSEPFYIQFGIWGDYWKGGSHTETVASRKYVSGGSGASGSWSLGSPSGWWNKQPSDPLDFSRADDFYRIGVVLWDGASTCIPMGTEWSAAGCPETAYKYFPMTVKISVYASGGSGPPPPPPATTPDYSIDYWGERTDKVISSEHQYSYNSNFSSTVDGNGQYLYLSPGSNVYFRSKNDYSLTQTLTVNSRPGAPAFGIDVANERTSTVVSSEYQYSSNSDMSSPSTGNGSYVSLTPGSSTYFRKLATGSAFASSIQELYMPGSSAAPDYAINYWAERTDKEISTEDQYSYNSNFSTVMDGNGQFLTLTPGTDVYFRKKADYSLTQTLTVPERPDAPTFAIDYTAERTSTTVSGQFKYSASSNMTSSTTGDGSYVSLIPGNDIHFRKSATSSAFYSKVQTLSVANRPSTPNFGIDYANRRTNTVVSSEYQHSANSDMSSATSGDGSYLSLTPESSVYFRKLAGASSFVSLVQELIVPGEPDAPIFEIDFINSRTKTIVESSHEYGMMADMTDANSGTGDYVDISPGTSVYFRAKATASGFFSKVQSLVAPAKPAAPSFQIDYMKEEISSVIGTAYVYGSSPDLSDATQGSDNILSVSPGVNIYFQALASGSAFASEIQILESSARPAAPLVGIDFANETSDVPISTELQYSSSNGFETAENGSGAALDLIPGTEIYFRQSATASSFSSEAFLLIVPERPVVSSTESGSTILHPFMLNITFFHMLDAMDASMLSVANAELKNFSLKNSGSSESIFEGEVFASANDVISIGVPANIVDGGNFISDNFKITFTGMLPGVGIESIDLSSFIVYPNPGKGIFHLKFENFDSQATYKVECCSINGKVVHAETFFGLEDVSMDLSGLAEGIYLLRLSEGEQIKGLAKLIIK